MDENRTSAPETAVVPAADAARREHHLAAVEAELADSERRAAGCAAIAWQRSAHRLAAEVHADAARSFDSKADRHDLEAEAAARKRGDA